MNLENLELFPESDKQITIHFKKDLAIRPNWNVEANFLSLPIFCFDKRGSSQKEGELIRTTPVLGLNGVIATGQIIISTGHREENGRRVLDNKPGALDMSVLYCIMDLWDEQGRRDSGEVQFNLSELCRRLKMSDGGKNFNLLRTSLLRLKRTTIESKNSFYSARVQSHVTTSISILDDILLVSNQGNKNPGSYCTLTLGKQVLENLKNRHIAIIDRSIFQSLEHSFAQRILSLALFKQQILENIGVIDFELFELAEMIPISGKLYPSLIKERLKKSLNELELKKVFSHEYIKINGNTILRLKAFKKQEQFLVGQNSISSFFEIYKYVHGHSPEDLLGLKAINFKFLFEKHPEEIVIDGKKYSNIFYVADIICHMILKEYKVDQPTKLFSSLLQKKFNDIDRPIDWIPVDALYIEKKQKESIETTLKFKQNNELKVLDAIENISKNYVDLITDDEFDKYKRIAIENNVFLSSHNKLDRNSPMLCSIISTLIKVDIQNGVEIKLKKVL